MSNVHRMDFERNDRQQTHVSIFHLLFLHNRIRFIIHLHLSKSKWISVVMENALIALFRLVDKLVSALGECPLIHVQNGAFVCVFFLKLHEPKVFVLSSLYRL